MKTYISVFIGICFGFICGLIVSKYSAPSPQKNNYNVTSDQKELVCQVYMRQYFAQKNAKDKEKIMRSYFVNYLAK